MTLVAGFLCSDGFVIAADTEETTEIRSHTTKVEIVKGPYKLVVGVSGDSVFARELATGIISAVDRIESPTIGQAQEAIKTTLLDYYQENVFPYWSNNNAGAAPYIGLVIGMMDGTNAFRLWKTQDHAMASADTAFAGSGQVVGSYVGERLLRPDMPVSVVRHLAIQIMREAKNRGQAVGGNTETWAVRTPRSDRCFELDVYGRDYLWSLEDALASAVRGALSGHDQAVSRRIAFLSKRLNELCVSAKKDRASNETCVPGYDNTRHDLDPNIDMDFGRADDEF